MATLAESISTALVFAIPNVNVACFALIWVWALLDNELIYWNSALVTLPSAIFVASMAAAALISAFSMLVILLPVPSASKVLLVKVAVLEAVMPPIYVLIWSIVAFLDTGVTPGLSIIATKSSPATDDIAPKAEILTSTIIDYSLIQW